MVVIKFQECSLRSVTMFSVIIFVVGCVLVLVLFMAFFTMDRNFILKQDDNGWVLLKTFRSSDFDATRDYFNVFIENLRGELSEDDVYVLINHNHQLLETFSLKDITFYAFNLYHRPGPGQMLYILDADYVEGESCTFWAKNDRDALQRFFSSHFFWQRNGKWSIHKDEKRIAWGLVSKVCPKRIEGGIVGGGRKFAIESKA